MPCTEEGKENSSHVYLFIPNDLSNKKNEAKKHIQLKKETQKLVKRKGRRKKHEKLENIIVDVALAPVILIHRRHIKSIWKSCTYFHMKMRNGVAVNCCYVFFFHRFAFVSTNIIVIHVSCCCFLAIHEIYRRKFDFFLLSQTLITLSLSTNARWIYMWRKFFSFSPPSSHTDANSRLSAKEHFFFVGIAEKRRRRCAMTTMKIYFNKIKCVWSVIRIYRGASLKRQKRQQTSHFSCQLFAV